MARANVHGTGVFVTQGVREFGGLRWQFKTDDPGSNTAVVVQGSTVYFGHDGDIHALDAATGTEKWMSVVDTQHSSAPAVAGDTLYVGAWEKLYALSTSTGRVKWIFEPDPGSRDYGYADPAIADGTVYFGGWNSLYALDSETGRKLWKYDLIGIAEYVPTIYAGTVYMGTSSPSGTTGGYLYAIDSNSGQENWKVAAPGYGINGAVAATDGVVYASTNDGLVALDAASGQEKWRYKKGTVILASPAVAYCAVFITDVDTTDVDTLYALDAQTGKEIWKFQGNGSFVTYPVLADGIIYFGVTKVEGVIPWLAQLSGELHVVDAQSGQVLWNFGVNGNIEKDPTVSDGTVYVVSEEDILYALK